MNLTERAKQYILANYDRHTLKHISGHLHVSDDVVLRFMRSMGLKQPPKPRRTYKLDDDIIHPYRENFQWAYPSLKEYGL